MTTYYNPNIPPDLNTWVKLSLDEQTRLAKNFHDSARIKASKQHAYLHVYVENQIASGFRPAIRALDRLQGEGLGRHDAIHMIATVFAAYYQQRPATPSRKEQSDAQIALNAELDALTVSDCTST
ncbi:hypothetical protein [Uliginosibacterium gangwonense]|uniref:hypothetical protein n=1 Tax=Uliginosibacterium gangwonense TaxID=392736 RepID=UPI00037680D9|nr:hypothetical protein [Uliginosibacterium gangwonense]